MSDTDLNPPLLEVKDLRKGYRLGTNRLSVLDGLSLDLVAAELVAIMGPSGSGKTTLLNCVSGVDVPDDGEIVLSGESLDMRSERVRTALRRHRLGMVFQFFNLIPTLTVAENVGLPLLINKDRSGSGKERVRFLLEQVRMWPRRDHYPFQLSGGEMQLTSIARSLVHNPDLLLADEPTGNVNPEIGRSIMRILRAMAAKEETGVLMVTHSPEHAAWADRICFLKQGRIVAEPSAPAVASRFPTQQGRLSNGVESTAPPLRRGEEDYQAMRLAVRLASLIAFAMGAIIVFYTMRFSVASRSREFALLLCPRLPMIWASMRKMVNMSI